MAQESQAILKTACSDSAEKVHRMCLQLVFKREGRASIEEVAVSRSSGLHGL
jgi:hypothetical protein